MRPAFSLLLCLLWLPQQPPRDSVPRAETAGTAVIRGAVVAADTGMPVRGATVNLSMMPPRPSSPPYAVAGVGVIAPGGNAAGAQLTTPPMPSFRGRQATTDVQGAFEFTALPAGSYRLFVSPPLWYGQYLGTAYGAKGAPPDPGQTVTLVADQVFDKAIIALPRGAVITGRVTDETGIPIARVSVAGLWYPPGSPRGVRSGGGVQTDDLGQFRLFGLNPGEYVVLAESRNQTFVPPNAAVERNDETTGMLTTYYPGTADEASAQRIRTATGRETGGIEIRMLQGRLYRVTGVVFDSQGKPARVNGSLMQRGPGSFMSGSGFVTDEQGRFQMRNLAPGNYRLVIRPGSIMTSSTEARITKESANVPLVVNGDVEGLTIVTSPGVTITGRIVIDSAMPAPPQPPQVRVMASPADEFMGVSSPSAQAEPDLTFKLEGLVGEYLLRAYAGGVYLKSVSVGATDVTDTPREFKAQDRVTIVLTSRTSSLAGTVTDSTGKPASEAGVILFPEDKSGWRMNSARLHRTMAPDGHFDMRGLLPGRYYVVAAPRGRLMLAGPAEPSYFEELSKDATIVVIGEEEQRTIDLTLTGTS